jgi:hypothetical protein
MNTCHGRISSYCSSFIDMRYCLVRTKSLYIVAAHQRGAGRHHHLDYTASSGLQKRVRRSAPGISRAAIARTPMPMCFWRTQRLNRGASQTLSITPRAAWQSDFVTAQVRRSLSDLAA